MWQSSMMTYFDAGHNPINNQLAGEVVANLSGGMQLKLASAGLTGPLPGYNTFAQSWQNIQVRDSTHCTIHICS